MASWRGREPRIGRRLVFVHSRDGAPSFLKAAKVANVSDATESDASGSGIMGVVMIVNLWSGDPRTSSINS